MNETTRKFVDEALRLSVAERAEIAAALLASIDGPADDDVEAAWAAEIARRVQLIRGGQAKARAWEEVREDLERRRK